MKLALFLCALLLSLQGWGASVNPSQPPAHEITPGLLGGLLIYITILFWWTIAAKNSLDKILKNVLQDIARYLDSKE